jgi:hypothetical protein
LKLRAFSHSNVCRWFRSYKNREFTDLIITWGTLTFKNHIVLVCSSCGLSRKIVSFAVGKEAEESHINLPEDDPESIRRLISYLNVGDYDASDELRIPRFYDIFQHESTTSPAATHHSRYQKMEPSGFLLACRFLRNNLCHELMTCDMFIWIHVVCLP